MESQIIQAALDQFWATGIKKSSMEDIAARAGVTRITVYRYFADKKELVRAAFLQMEALFQQQMEALEAGETPGREMAPLPFRDTAIRLDELKRLYPDIYAEFQAARLAVLRGLFDRLFAKAEQNNLVRPDLNRELIEIVFFELVTGLFDHPRLRELGLSNAELYVQIKSIFMHGMLR
jgi:AcrR family transcriptional regulator